MISESGNSYLLLTKNNSNYKLEPTIPTFKIAQTYIIPFGYDGRFVLIDLRDHSSLFSADTLEEINDYLFYEIRGYLDNLRYEFDDDTEILNDLFNDNLIEISSKYDLNYFIADLETTQYQSF